MATVELRQAYGSQYTLTQRRLHSSTAPEMKFLGGLANQEVAEVLKVTSRTVEREWRKSKAWLHRAISKGEMNEA
jgi:DNA-binding NarL/FixJ family response regulator